MSEKKSVPVWHHDNTMRIQHSCGLIFLLIATFAFQSAAQTPAPKHLLLRGNIVTPDGVIPHGWLDIYHGRIVHVEHEKPDIPDAQILETDDLIFPGFIDLHNHPSFNIFPRWTPPHKFPNRYAWRDLPVYQQQLESKSRALAADPANFCDIDEYVEIKALIGGTTSIIGLGSNHMPGEGPSTPECIRGLVRNLDHYTGFYGTEVDHERIANSIGILPRDMDANTAAHYAQSISNDSLDLLAIHIAEGLPTDAESAQEFDMLEAHGLLGSHTALIHSVGLSPSQLARVHRAGASIVWSPRSNFELYGETANVAAAFRQGVTISLAPDWSPTGSDNMWEEIQYADNISRRDLSSLFTSHQLVEMAAGVPARVARIDDKVGAIAPGMNADFFLVKPTYLDSQPYDTIVRQPITSIDLVVIDGTPIYGDPKILHALDIATEPLKLCGTEKALNSVALPNGPFAQVEARLRVKMKALGTELGPLDSCPTP
ncbi:MAG TPA: amidohydrolase family protein [Acidobacteriaceae bacterium]|jgi:cytosine/adenosine deaminase-related metal-dependent hydrolase|nr:amidohydrolase family protein [Acidobacteriaceae bacterium]